MKLSREKGKIDWLITLLPLAIIIALFSVLQFKTMNTGVEY